MTLIKFKNNFPSFLDEFLGHDAFKHDINYSNSASANSFPAINIKNHNDHFELEMAAPGLQKEDFKIEIQNNVLDVSSETKNENKEDQKNYTRREFNYRSFKRTFTLPEYVSEKNISANYEKGVLRIEIPKKIEEQKESSRLIKIK